MPSIFDYNILNDPEVARILNGGQMEPIQPTIPNQLDNSLAGQPEQVQKPSVNDAGGVINYLTSMKQPVYDAEQEKKLKNAAKITTIGETLGNIAQAIGYGSGATVNHNRPNNTLDWIYGHIQGNKDAYTKALNDYQYKQAQNYLRNLQLAMQQERSQTTAEKNAADLKLKEAKMTQDQKNADRNYKLNENKAKNDKAYKDGYLDYLNSKESSTSSKLSTQEKKAAHFLQWQDPNKPNPEWINEADFRKYYNDALINADPSDIKTVMAQYQNNPMEAKKQIVINYLNRLATKPNDVIMQNNPLGLITPQDYATQYDSPAQSAPTVQQPKQQTSPIDYSKLKY